jgi:hypothetical protein
LKHSLSVQAWYSNPLTVTISLLLPLGAFQNQFLKECRRLTVLRIGGTRAKRCAPLYPCSVAKGESFQPPAHKHTYRHLAKLEQSALARATTSIFTHSFLSITAESWITAPLNDSSCHSRS